MNGLKGKTAIITGGAQGIGLTLTKRFFNEGLSQIALLDYNAEQLDVAVQNFQTQGYSCLGFVCDVSNREDVRKAIAEANSALGEIDILINNAGITRDSMFHKMTDEAWDAVIQINLTGTANLSREIYPLMRARGQGSIINISSTSGWGNIGQANYAASKAGVLGLTKTLAMEGGRFGVRVNAIAPGCIRTDMLSTVPEKILNNFKDSTLLKRLGEPEEIASVAAFLASEDASFITGQCISVSGGMLCL